MTLNNSWGFNRGDDALGRMLKTVIDNLSPLCSVAGGNYLLNIGPMLDGLVPAASVEISSGRWQMDRYEWQSAIYGTERGKLRGGDPQRQLHAARQYPLHPSALLAGPHTCSGVAKLLSQPQAVFAIGGLKPKAPVGAPA